MKWSKKKKICSMTGNTSQSGNVAHSHQQSDLMLLLVGLLSTKSPGFANFIAMLFIYAKMSGRQTCLLTRLTVIALCSHQQSNQQSLRQEIDPLQKPKQKLQNSLNESIKRASSASKLHSIMNRLPFIKKLSEYKYYSAMKL